MNQQETTSLNGFPLSSHQRRLWLRQDRALLCVQTVVLVEGHCDPALLKTALRRIVGEHEILRTTFQAVPGMKMPLQVACGEPEFSWQECHIDGEKALNGVCAQERQREFQLESGPVLRAILRRWEKNPAISCSLSLRCAAILGRSTISFANWQSSITLQKQRRRKSCNMLSFLSGITHCWMKTMLQRAANIGVKPQRKVRSSFLGSLLNQAG